MRKSHGLLAIVVGAALPVYGSAGKIPQGAQPRYVLPEKLRRVASINLSESSLSGHELSALRAFPHLRTLVIRNTGASVGGIQALQRQRPKLRILHSKGMLR